MSVLIGLQAIAFAAVARRYATLRGLLPPSTKHDNLLRSLTPDRLVGIGAVLFGLGSAGLLWSLWQWVAAGFGPIEDLRVLRGLLLSFTALAAGFQLILLAFLANLMELPQRLDETVIDLHEVEPDGDR
jgi:hypothetical protein